MKRFTETGKWRDPWFLELSHGSKLLFFYLIENCNNAGFYEENIREACFHLGVEEAQYQNAIKGLSRGIEGASGWIWVRRFLRHQNNDDLNPNNPAHRQIISQLRDQLDRFKNCSVFQSFIAPYKGLLSPTGKGTGIGTSKGTGKKVARFQKPTREEAQAYAKEIGLSSDQCDSWYDHFESNGWKVSGKTTMQDWKAAMRNAKRNPLLKRGGLIAKPEEKFRVV